MNTYIEVSRQMRTSLMSMIFLFAANFASSQQNMISINAAEAKYTINKNIYGYFTEHPGNCIYNGFCIGDTNVVLTLK